MKVMSFHLKIENFEGPIDALLQLIEKRKMSISDVSLARIADEYIHFVQSLEEESLSNITYFILVASTLTLIKSKSLLPGLELTEEEEGDIYELKKRIALYKMYQDIAKKLKNNFSRKKSFLPARAKKVPIQFSPHQNLNLSSLHESMLDIFKEVPQKESKKKEAYIKIAIHIEEIMKSLEERIKKNISFDFDSFINAQVSGDKNAQKVKVYRVVGFLAMLELVKNGVLSVLQNKNFDRISLERAEDTHTLS